MKQLKIQKEFWDLIVSGKKKYEFRKLSKGLTSGTYEFVSVEKHKVKENVFDFHNMCVRTYNGYECNCDNPTCGIKTNKIVEIEKHIVFGTATLEPIIVINNSPMNRLVNYWNFIKEYRIDNETKNWVDTNYIDKDIEFIAYEISNVKENNG